MPQLRSKPRCRKCGQHHWNIVKCENADAAEDSEIAHEQRRRDFIIKRPREGYREFGDVLEPETERVGRSTFAIRREPGQQIGSFRN